MENSFEKYLGDNQEQFEEGGPSPEVWQKLKGQLVQHHQQKAIALKRRMVQWCVAASLLLVLGAGLVYYLWGYEKDAPTTGIVKTATPDAKNKLPIIDSNDSKKIVAKKQALEDLLAQDTFTVFKKKARNTVSDNNKYRQWLFYYTSIVDEKQKKISKLQSTDPELYAAFQKAIADMQAIYTQLKTKLPGSLDQEKVLQDMIEDLKIQELMLNNQLQVIKKIHSNKAAKNEQEQDEI